MAIERSRNPPRRRNLSTPARVALGALAIFGAITLVQWVLASIIAFVKFGLLVVVVIAVGAWVIGAKSSR